MARVILTRRALLGGLAAGVCAAGPLRTAWGDGTRLLQPQEIEVHARAVPHFHRQQAGTRRFGDLEYRGGVVLSSPSPAFGEWSGLVMDADGRRLLAVSDQGYWMSANIAYNRDSALAGFAGPARVGPLLDLQGRPLLARHEQDAEAIALVDGTLDRGTLLVGFERQHRIARCEVRGGQPQAPSALLPMPPETERLGPNAGLEAVAVLQGGPLKGAPVAFAERFAAEPGYHTGWIWVDEQPKRILLQDTDGFDITGAAGLPDGGLLVLERAYVERAGTSGLSRMRIRQLSAAEIAPGARLTGRAVMQADSDAYEVDNMEALAVHRGGRGETVVSLMSDDNLNPRQRTLLLQFTLMA